jgi:charged multivesicular body protein 3
MEDMLEDTLDMDEDEDIAEEADAEVDKVLFELTNGKAWSGRRCGDRTAGKSTNTCVCIAMSSKYSQSLQNTLEDEETEKTMEQYRQQLDGLLSG